MRKSTSFYVFLHTNGIAINFGMINSFGRPIIYIIYIQKASNLSEGFCQNDDIEKIIALFSTKSLVRIVAKTCFLILRKRNNLLYI